MKKVLLLIFLLFGLFVLGSCGDKENPKDEETPVVNEPIIVEFYTVNNELIAEYNLKQGDSVTEYPECEEEGDRGRGYRSCAACYAFRLRMFRFFRLY